MIAEIRNSKMKEIIKITLDLYCMYSTEAVSFKSNLNNLIGKLLFGLHDNIFCSFISGVYH